jgi:hypothetical protein
MSDDNDRDDKYYNAEAYWKRKQSAKENRVSGEAPLAAKDKDREADNYSFGQKGYSEHMKSPKSSTIWEDEPWQDKQD